MNIHEVILVKQMLQNLFLFENKQIRIISVVLLFSVSSLNYIKLKIKHQRFLS